MDMKEIGYYLFMEKAEQEKKEKEKRESNKENYSDLSFSFGAGSDRHKEK